MLNNFTTPLDFNEMTFELRSRKEIKSTTQIGDYLQLITDSGEFYLKYNGVSDNEFRYSLFAEVGLADDFGENIYIPFHMLIWFENCDYPAIATPFKGQVYFSKQFSLVDVHGYYESKGIYTVEQVNDNVRVLSVTENIDSANEEDDLIIGFKGIMNDMYAKDIAKKVRAGYKQKQKEGIITSPPLGYFKDRNTDEIVIVEEEAEIVRRIFDLFLDGYGLKSIAHMLNDEGINSPLYYQNKRFKKRTPYTAPKITHRFLWVNTTVKRILQNEFYKGTLVCHKSYTSKIYHIRKMLPNEEHFVHEDFVPAIISKEKWEQVQFLLQSKTRKNIRASSSKPCHRYAGLLKCAECGCSFVCKTRKNSDSPNRFEYNCNGYHRYGTEHCTAHRIDEDMLDKLIYSELLSIGICRIFH